MCPEEADDDEEDEKEADDQAAPDDQPADDDEEDAEKDEEQWKEEKCLVDETLTPSGAHTCSSDDQCRGYRTCSSHGWCQGDDFCDSEYVPPVPEECYYDETTHPVIREHRCFDDSHCKGARTCSDWLFCEGDSGCPI